MDFHTALHLVLDDNLKKDLDNVPGGFYALEVDEATDASNHSVLILCLRYIKDGAAVSRYVGVCELPNTCSEDIHKAVKSVMTSKGLELTNMVGLATDGAAAMTGVHKGVATRFKREQPHLISVHCMAHRLQLVSEKAANQVPYFVKYIGILNAFAKALKCSPKLCRTLEQAKELHNEKACKVKQVFFTRWLSLRDSVQALTGCLGAVVSCLAQVTSEPGSGNKAVLQGVLKQMATFKFMATTHFLADAMGYLGILNLSMQKETASYNNLKPQIKATVDSLNALLTKDGQHMRTFYKDLSTEGETTVYHTHIIKDGPLERKKFKDSATKFVHELQHRLEATFPDAGLLDALSILNPQLVPKEGDLQSYGCKQMSALVDFYGHPIDGVDGAHQNLVDPIQTNVEWELIKSVMRTHPESDTAAFYKSFLLPNKDSFCNLFTLASVCLTLPCTSVNCERAISAYNLIKTDRRNRLTTDYVDTQLCLMMEAPPLKEFDFDLAFKFWLKAKDRRGFVSMSKEAMIQKAAGDPRQCLSSSKDLLHDWNDQDTALDLTVTS